MKTEHEDFTGILTWAKKPRAIWRLAGGALFLVIVGSIAWLRSGMLDLPGVPDGLTLEQSGLGGLDKMRELDAVIWSAEGTNDAAAKNLSPGALLVRSGISKYRHGETSAALNEMAQGVRLEPNNLVLANAYRMVLFSLRRDFLAAARRQQAAIPTFPPELDHQPIRFFEELERAHSTRETKLNLALAWVDEMLLFPALEIKAPSSVQAVDLLSGVIDQGNSGYVPALFARGLNHLHRPARLVWPESAKTKSDAAAQDIGRCVAIGRHFRTGSDHLQAILAMTLGDAWVKTGRLGVARSWWQIAQNLSHDPQVQTAIHERYAWHDEEILDRLEENLDRSRSDISHPMTDLALMWN